MMQVILNLLKNAQDVLKEEAVEKPYIKVTTEERKILICDNGGGISSEIINKVFDPYFSTKEDKNGTGLGLYMSKMIVEEHHNGSLTVENSADGACFTIILGEELNLR
jgi:signal transduction histidine kinase